MRRASLNAPAREEKRMYDQALVIEAAKKQIETNSAYPLLPEEIMYRPVEWDTAVAIARGDLLYALQDLGYFDE